LRQPSSSSMSSRIVILVVGDEFFGFIVGLSLSARDYLLEVSSASDRSCMILVGETSI